MILLLAFLFVVLIASVTVSWYIHILQVKTFCEKYGRASYKSFIREFNKYNWKDDIFSKSLFDRDNKSIFHASIIQFNNIGMIMRNPIDWCLVCLYVYNYGKNIEKKKEIYNWEEI